METVSTILNNIDPGNSDVMGSELKSPTDDVIGNEFNTSIDDVTLIPSASLGLVGDEVMPYVQTINLFVILTLLSLLGIVTNTINIIVFVRQGFKDTINISLLGLAISDLLSLVSLLWVATCYNPFFLYSDLPILPIELQHYTGGGIHIIATRITIFITAFITLERCICVVFPLKVKTLLTPRRVKVIILTLFAIPIGSMLPNFLIFRFGWKYVPELNRTMFGSIYFENRFVIENINFHVQLIYPTVSFTLIIICTAILVSKFNQRIKWRQGTTTGANTSGADVRDRQVVKMVINVATIFIVCFTPSLFLFFGMIFVPGLNIGELNHNLFVLSYSVSFAAEAINSSVNIFVYYRTSTKFREQFHRLFAKNRTKTLDPA